MLHQARLQQFGMPAAAPARRRQQRGAVLCMSSMPQAPGPQGPGQPSNAQVPGKAAASQEGPAGAGASSTGAGGATSPDTPQQEDTPDRSAREVAQMLRAAQRARNQPMTVPAPIPAGRLTPVDQASGLLDEAGPSPAEIAALQTALQSLPEDERSEMLQQIADTREAIFDQDLDNQLASLTEEQAARLQAALASPYNELDFWERTLLEPIKRDVIRDVSEGVPCTHSV